MKIRVAILERDVGYLNRLSSAFGMKYPDKLEIYSFTDPVQAAAELTKSKIDVFLAGDAFPEALERIPDRCGTAFLVDSASIESLYGRPAICRFQKIDMIYKRILDVYSETAKDVVEKKTGGGTSITRVLCFSAPAGGVGVSSLAAACALHLAGQNHRVLYLNLERFGSAEEYFTGDGAFTMTDVIYALKSGKANFAMKLESCVRRDARGVCFFAPPKYVMDIMELTADDQVQLLRQLRMTNAYDDVVLDIDYSLDGGALSVYGEASTLVWVSDGSTTANEKTLRALDALRVLESRLPDSLERKLCLIYNKFSNKGGVTVPENTIRSLGGAPRFDHATTAQVLGKLAEKTFFDMIE